MPAPTFRAVLNCHTPADMHPTKLPLYGVLTSPFTICMCMFYAITHLHKQRKQMQATNKMCAQGPAHRLSIIHGNKSIGPAAAV